MPKLAFIFSSSAENPCFGPGKSLLLLKSLHSLMTFNFSLHFVLMISTASVPICIRQRTGFLYPLCEAYVNNLKWWKKVFSTTIGTARSSQNLCKWELSHKLYFRFPQGPDLDVIVTQEVLNSKIKQAISIYGHIDVLVNNAGYVQAGLLEAVS